MGFPGLGSIEKAMTFYVLRIILILVMILPMYVCICHGVTDRQIREAAARGARSIKELKMSTGCAGSCGQCATEAKSIIKQVATEQRDEQSFLPVLA